MLGNIVAGLITAVILAWVALLWRHRGYWSLLWATVWPAGQLRVSVAALVRVKDDDCYILFHHPYRPSAYGPPGGVIKSKPTARKTLDALGFIEQRVKGRESTMVRDLRGFVPARRGIGFMRWYATGQDRESGAEGARRELAEELGEAGHPELTSLAADVRLDLVRAVFEPPRLAPEARFRTMRAFEVFDIVEDSTDSVELVCRLLALGRDPAETQIIAVSSSDILAGRHNDHLLAPQSAFLLGDRRVHQDLAALR